MIQWYKDTRIQGNKDTRIQGNKDTSMHELQELKNWKLER